jgi:hypothetical protein
MIAGPTAQNLAKGSASTSSTITPVSGSFSASGAGPKFAPKQASTDTRISKPAKSTKHRSKPASEEKRKKARLPKEKRRVRPPAVTGYTWRKDGAGWELRKSVYVVSDTGIRKRRLPYVAHLSKSAFGELKRKHRGAALERAIAQWIEERDR